MPAEMLVPCAFVGITAFRIVAIHIGLTRKPPPENKLFFQTIHAVHLAGDARVAPNARGLVLLEYQFLRFAST